MVYSEKSIVIGVLTHVPIIICKAKLIQTKFLTALEQVVEINAKEQNIVEVVEKIEKVIKEISKQRVDKKNTAKGITKKKGGGKENRLTDS